jgi:uncharacterized protein YjbI with pentapeptide repeats
MGIIKKIGLLLKETIISPSTESYVIDKGTDTLVIRSKGDYEGIDLSGVDLSATQLKNINLRGAILKGANLDNADFSGADLTNADLSGTTISGTHFDASKLEGVNFNDASFETQPSGVTQDILKKIKEGSKDE